MLPFWVDECYVVGVETGISYAYDYPFSVISL